MQYYTRMRVCILCPFFLLHTATHCSTLQHTATQHTATHCDILHLRVHTHGEHEVMISKMSQRQIGVMSAAVVLKTIDFLVEA